MNSALYKQIDVWKKIDVGCAIKFRCFENLEKKMFCVQSADYFYISKDEKQFYDSERQLIELFIEELPDNRSKLFSTLEDAIAFYFEEFCNT